MGAHIIPGPWEVEAGGLQVCALSQNKTLNRLAV